MEPIEKIAETSFHGIDYILKISVKDDQLQIELEQKDNGNRWKNMFTTAVIEDITQKTGNFKKFPIFVRMLLSSISKNSDSVFLDILTSQDLEMLKARKQKQPSMSTNTSLDKSKISNKRYMILTYVVEFDKVHYPLPLNFDENPDIEALKNTIRRLRNEIDDLKSQTRQSQEGGFFMTEGQLSGNTLDSKSEITTIKLENESLKQKVKKLEETMSSSFGFKKGGAVEYDILLKSKMELETDLENVKKDYIRDVKRLKTKLEETEKELEDTREELIKSRENPDPLKSSKGTEDKEAELLASKKIIAKHIKEVEKLTQEIEEMKSIDKKQKARIKQLEIELESALKRVSSSRGIHKADHLNSPYSRSRGNSPNDSGSKRSNSLPNKVFSPSASKGYERKPTPTKKPVITNKYGSKNSTGGSDSENNGKGQSKLRNANSSPLRVNGMGTDPLKKLGAANLYGNRKQSPKPRNYSPSSKFTNSPGSMLNKSSPSSKFGGGIKGTSLNNDLNKKPKAQVKTNNYMSDSEDESSQLTKKIERPNPLNKKNNYTSSITSTQRSGYNPKAESISQKLKENINELKESKLSVATNREPEEKTLNLTKELDTSEDTNDIDQRLSKLNELLKRAKN